MHKKLKFNIHSEVQTCQIKYQNWTEPLSVHECLSLGSSVVGTAMVLPVMFIRTCCSSLDIKCDTYHIIEYDYYINHYII